VLAVGSLLLTSDCQRRVLSVQLVYPTGSSSLLPYAIII
jgi:hypothetical protein